MALIPKNRFVAFIDLLGVSQYTQNEESSNRYVQALYAIVSTILKKEGFFMFRHIRADHEVEVELFRPADERVKLTAVSDALVVSVPEFSAGELGERSRLLQIMFMLEVISDLQSSLAAVGLLSRGGVAYGPLLHTRDVVVGAGLVRAYQIENKRAVFPRTVVDKDIIEILLTDELPREVMGVRSRIAHAISKDADGEYYVNYFGFRPISGGVVHQRENLARMADEKEAAMATTRDHRVVQKLEWFYRYVKDALESYSDPVAYLQCNEGTDFHKRYPRIFENLQHMTDNLLKNGFYIDPFDEKIEHEDE